jgi:HK97 gp10 family phage protein
MADNSFRMELQGVKEFQSRIQAAPVEIQKQVQAIITDGAYSISSEAKQRTSQFSGGYTKGILRNLITNTRAESSADGYTATVTSGAEYSAYVEFGTGDHVDVPADLEEFAIQFKGTKKVKGMRAQPFFFNSAKRIWPIIESKIEKLMDSL